MSEQPELRGTVEQGFGPVADAFLRNFDLGFETGAACAVYSGGREVVNIWAGTADTSTGQAWDVDTTALVFSSTKGVTAVCAHLLVQRGDLDLDAPVAAYWPEFAQAGKADLPVRYLLSHQAGLPVFDEMLTHGQILAWDPPVAALAAQEPVWEPGSTHGYHAITYGWLVGELIRRVSGKSVGRFLAAEVSAPLGLSTWIGVPPAEQARVSLLTEPSPQESQPASPDTEAFVASLLTAFMDPTSITARAFTLNGALTPADGEDPRPERDPDYLSAELPAVNGVSDARSLARLYASCVGEVDGRRLLDAETMATATTRQAEGPDAVLSFPLTWGLGFMLPSSTTPMYGPSSFGHPGSGGSLGFGDLDAEIGFGYVMNRMGNSVMADPRKTAMITALQRILG